MKKRVGDPGFDIAEFGRRLATQRGIGLNLLVHDVGLAVKFHELVLEAFVEYVDPDMAIVRLEQSTVLLHADHSYDRHPMVAEARTVEKRGAGAELRVYGLNPDRAESNAREHGFMILASAATKPHGLRECYLQDRDGYVWVPSIGV
jgi:uncharacterized glyoxalase superfamily protein PhnB